MTEFEIACDAHEGDEFVEYLNSLGYDAWLGNSTGNFVNGGNTDCDPVAAAILEQLWDDYCSRPESEKEE